VNLTQKIAIAAGALTLGAAGVAAAATPDAADTGVTKASEQVEIEVPANEDSHSAVEADDLETSNDEATDVEETEDEGVGPVDNHGAEVSAVAQSDDTEGREHGEAVSAVAQDNHGAEVEGTHDETGDDSADAADESTEAEEHARS
jgi:hypothetical protein